MKSKLTIYVIVLLCMISLFFGIYNMSEWIIKVIVGIAGLAYCISFYINTEEKNKKKNQ